MSDIQYPVALASNGLIVKIADWPRHTIGQCTGCYAPMIARKGDINRWHFAHHGAPCGLESWLLGELLGNDADTVRAVKERWREWQYQ